MQVLYALPLLAGALAAAAIMAMTGM